MKIKFMFHGSVLTGYFIRRLENNRVLIYMPERYRVLRFLRDYDYHFLNLDAYHLAIPDKSTGVPRNPDYQKFVDKYPVSS
ncbi:MAG: hypothetical protein OXH00_26070 [Candidatus Poribacteria bacterium]|nr:hypothetical protein [Candidatus Poribacteria bacterium]